MAIYIRVFLHVHVYGSIYTDALGAERALFNDKQRAQRQAVFLFFRQPLTGG